MTKTKPTPESEVMPKQQRNALHISWVTFALHFLIGVILFITNESAQINTFDLIPMSFLVAITSFVSVLLCRRKRVYLGITLIIGVFQFAVLVSVIQLSGLGVAAALVVTIFTSGIANSLLPGKLANRLVIVSVLIALFSVVLDFWNPWPRLPNLQPQLTWIVSGVLLLLYGAMILRRMFLSGRLRNRIIALTIAILGPILIIFSLYNIQIQRQDLEELLLENSEQLAKAGATIISNDLEKAIERGDLTAAEAFDRNYVKFWEFDPAADPNFDPEAEPDPDSFDKYHTAYDDYTDEHWQVLVDSFLTREDILYASAVDINGYLPTHNTRYSVGDGSAANDRTKRIFDDPVGIRAARNTEPVLQQVYSRPGTDETLWDISAPIYVNGRHWGAFRVGVELAGNQQRVISATWRSGVTAGLVLLAILVFSGLFGSYISDPIETLTESATEVAEGQLDQVIEVPNRDEITELAIAFNEMTAQLRRSFDTLEQQVADRTRDLEQRSEYLEGAAEVSRAANSILEPDALISQVVNLIRERFDLYYVGLFLVDQSQEWAVLQAGTGVAGRKMLARGHRIKVGEGMIGWCIANAEGRIALDVGADAVRFENPDLPETRSEGALPLRSRGRVLGALTVQSAVEAAFDQDIITALQNMADQVAIALDNAELLARSEAALAAERRAYGQMSQAAWKEIRKRSIPRYRSDAADVVYPLKEAHRPTEVPVTERIQVQEDGFTAIVPIKIQGYVLGGIKISKSEASGKWTAEQLEMAQNLSEQMGVALESARLYEETQQRAAREQLAGQITARMRESLSIKTILDTAAREIGTSLGLEGVNIRLSEGVEQ